MDKQKLINELKKDYPYRDIDCLGCSNSLSDEETEELFCSIHKKWVEADEICEDYN